MSDLGTTRHPMKNGATGDQLSFRFDALLQSKTRPSQLEKLLTIAEAAEALGVHMWALRRAIKRGDVPSYAPFNSRRFVRLTEVIAFIEASRQGGE